MGQITIQNVECIKWISSSNDEAHQTLPLGRKTTQPAVVLTVPCSRDTVAARSRVDVHRWWDDEVTDDCQAAEYDDWQLLECCRESRRQCVEWRVNDWTDEVLVLQCWLQWVDSSSVVHCADWWWTFQLVTPRRALVRCSLVVEHVSVHWSGMTSQAGELMSLTVWMDGMCQIETLAASAFCLHRLQTLAR